MSLLLADRHSCRVAMGCRRADRAACSEGPLPRLRVRGGGPPRRMHRGRDDRLSRRVRSTCASPPRRKLFVGRQAPPVVRRRRPAGGRTWRCRRRRCAAACRPWCCACRMPAATPMVVSGLAVPSGAGRLCFTVGRLPGLPAPDAVAAQFAWRLSRAWRRSGCAKVTRAARSACWRCRAWSAAQGAMRPERTAARCRRRSSTCWPASEAPAASRGRSGLGRYGVLAGHAERPGGGGRRAGNAAAGPPGDGRGPRCRARNCRWRAMNSRARRRRRALRFALARFAEGGMKATAEAGVQQRPGRLHRRRADPGAGGARGPGGEPVSPGVPAGGRPVGPRGPSFRGAAAADLHAPARPSRPRRISSRSPRRSACRKSWTWQ